MSSRGSEAHAATKTPMARVNRRDLADALETAFGDAMPRLEVRFKHLSIYKGEPEEEEEDNELKLPDAQAVADLVQDDNVDDAGAGGDAGADGDSTKMSVMEKLAAKLIPGRNLGGEGQTKSENPPNAAEEEADDGYDDDDDGEDEMGLLLKLAKKLVPQLRAKKRPTRKYILHNVSGVFEPGTMTLVLGQSDSGKSALMKALSARFANHKKLTIDGDMTYNGVPQHEIRKRLAQFVTYVNQNDAHLPGLTVEETLEFAHAFCGSELERRGEELLETGYSEENLEALQAAWAMLDNYPNVVIDQLGLRNCRDTIIGDAAMSSISDAERKRVAIGEMEASMKYVALMDEISTGLDGAATFNIICTQRMIAQKLKKTVVISLLQPSSEVFALFDNVLLLKKGEMMYHGPCSKVLDYFEDLGFKCPPERGVAEFLLDLGTPEQRHYQVDQEEKHPRRARQFASLFRKSDVYRDLMAALAAPHSWKALRTVKKHMDPTPKFHQPFTRSLQTLLKRHLAMALRTKASAVARLLVTMFMGFLYCTTFHHIDTMDIKLFMGGMFLAVIFLCMSQSTQIPVFMAEREVFYKQRGANFFGTSAYVLAVSASQILLALVEVIVYGVLVYCAGGFVSTVADFVVFEILLLLTSLVMGRWFFFLSSVGSTTNVVTPVAMVSILMAALFAGFLVGEDSIPAYVIWLYWMNPVSWILKGIVTNHYPVDTFDTCQYEGIDYCSNYNTTYRGYLMELVGVTTQKNWAGYAVLYTVGVYAVLVLLSILALEYRRHELRDPILVIEKKDKEEEYALAETPRSKWLTSSKDAVVLELDSCRDGNIAPVVVAFEHLSFSVPDPQSSSQPLEILRDVSGYAVPGSMTALVGPSGAGKSTLLDVIAGRKGDEKSTLVEMITRRKSSGTVTGKVTLNGYEADTLALRRCVGYCKQADSQSEAATFREALTFSAYLRQDSSVPDSEKIASVQECIELLGLKSVENQIIRNSSAGQKKRLAIGVELAARTSVLMLDEPTEGLDAHSAELVIESLRKLADTGLTIICAMNQPSAEIFSSFDRLLLLNGSGQMAFCGDLGDDCRNLVNHFEGIPGMEPLPADCNPATWALECMESVADASTEYKVDFVEFFNSSPYRQQLDSDLAKEGVTTPSIDPSRMAFHQNQAANATTQLKFVAMRWMRLYVRTPTYIRSRLLIAAYLAILIGLVYVNTDYISANGLEKGIAMTFLIVFFISTIAYHSVLPLAIAERASFYRESASQTYSIVWYIVGSTLAEMPYCFFFGLIFVADFFWFVGFSGFANAVVFWLALSLMVMMEVCMGQLFAYALPSEEWAAMVGVLLNSVFSLFAGYIPTVSSTPAGYKWLHAISPLKFPLSIMVSRVLGDCDDLPTWDDEEYEYTNVGFQIGCQPVENLPVTVGHTTVKEYLDTKWGMSRDDATRDFFVMLAYIVLFRLLAFLALHFLTNGKQ